MNPYLRTLHYGLPAELSKISHTHPETSMIDLANEVSKVWQRKIEIVLLEYPDSYPPDEPLRRCPDITKARLQLDYRPTVELSVGLERFMNWATETYTGTS